MGTKAKDVKQKKNYDKLIKVLQIAAGVFMLAMVIIFIVLMKKYDISVKNMDTITQKLSGGTLTLACIVILFNLVKSFALVVTPSIVYVASGLLFENVWTAILVNFIATVIGLFPPFFLGKFTGKGIVDTLKKKNKKISKIDDFAGKNGFMVTFLIKASGLIPGDTTSLIMGALDIPFMKFFWGTLAGTLPINVMWAFLGNKGDLSNPYTFLYLLPIIVFAVLMSLIVKKVTSKKKPGDADTAFDASQETQPEQEQ